MNNYKDVGTHLEIELTQDQVALVDYEDLEKVQEYKWCAVWDPSTKGFKVCSSGSVYLHRVLLYSPDGYSVDHRNRDTLDNRRCNLRLANSTQQILNQGVRKDNKSGFRGVTTRSNSFEARAGIKKEVHSIGYYNTPEEAATAYDSYVMEKYAHMSDEVSGDYLPFLYLNFPENKDEYLHNSKRKDSLS